MVAKFSNGPAWSLAEPARIYFERLVDVLVCIIPCLIGVQVLSGSISPE